MPFRVYIYHVCKLLFCLSRFLFNDSVHLFFETNILLWICLDALSHGIWLLYDYTWILYDLKRFISQELPLSPFYPKLKSRAGARDFNFAIWGPSGTLKISNRAGARDLKFCELGSLWHPLYYIYIYIYLFCYIYILFCFVWLLILLLT